MNLTRRTVSLCVLTATFSLASTESRAQSDFLRGDVNGDGVITISDAWFLYHFLSSSGGPAPACLKSADIDDNGTIDRIDANILFGHLRFFPEEPCSPFPQVGSDPHPDDLSCESYGGGTLLDDPEAELEIQVGEVDASGQVMLTVVLSSSRRIAGMSFDLLAGEAFAAENDFVRHGRVELLMGYGSSRQEAHKVQSVNIFDVRSGFDVAVGPGEDLALFTLHPCLEAGLPAGEYPIEVLAAEFADAETGRAIHPRRSAGTIVVSEPVVAVSGCLSEDEVPDDAEQTCGPPPPPQPQLANFLRGDANTDGRVSMSDVLSIRNYIFNEGPYFSCEEAADVNGDGKLNITDPIWLLNSLFFGLTSQLPVAPFPEVGPGQAGDSLGCERYEVSAPQDLGEVVDIGEAIAAPGQEVEVPVFLTNHVLLEAVQLLVSYDPTLIEYGKLTFTGSYFESVGPDSGLGTVRKVWTQEPGVFSAVFMPDIFYETHGVPPGEGQIVFNLLVKVSPDAEPGTIIDLIPTNGPDGEGIGIARLRNELTHLGAARFVSTQPTTEPGLIQIVGDLSIFRRGDSNLDAAVNISDPLYTLGYLFSGQGSLDCPDASDSNDDGRVDISDPISTLDHLFLGSGSLPPPSGSPGVDPTPDELGCEAPQG